MFRIWHKKLRLPVLIPIIPILIPVPVLILARALHALPTLGLTRPPPSESRHTLDLADPRRRRSARARAGGERGPRRRAQRTFT